MACWVIIITDPVSGGTCLTCRMDLIRRLLVLRSCARAVVEKNPTRLFLYNGPMRVLNPLSVVTVRPPRQLRQGAARTSALFGMRRLWTWLT